MPDLSADEAEREKWLTWSGGQYPDDSPGDVIAADADGTITLDDSIVTWNPLRALAFFEARLDEAEKQLGEANEMLAAVNEHDRIVSQELDAHLARLDEAERQTDDEAER